MRPSRCEVTEGIRSDKPDYDEPGAPDKETLPSLDGRSGEGLGSHVGNSKTDWCFRARGIQGSGKSSRPERRLSEQPTLPTLPRLDGRANGSSANPFIERNA